MCGIHDFSLQTKWCRQGMMDGVLLTPEQEKFLKKEGVKDSKQLTQIARLKLAEIIKKNVIDYKVVKAYPNFKVMATTLRTVKTATINDWSAICWANGEVYKANESTP